MTRPTPAPQDDAHTRPVVPDLTDILRLALGGLLPSDIGLSHWLDRMERAQ